MNENNGIYLKQAKEYEIDYSKIKTVEDVVNIIKGFKIRVYDNYENFSELLPYIKEINS